MLEYLDQFARWRLLRARNARSFPPARRWTSPAAAAPRLMAFSWAAALKSEQTIAEQCRRCQRCCVSADGCISHAAYRFDSSVTSVGLDIAVLGMVDGIWIVPFFKLTIFPPAQLKWAIVTSSLPAAHFLLESAKFMLQVAWCGACSLHEKVNSHRCHRWWVIGGLKKQSPQADLVGPPSRSSRLFFSRQCILRKDMEERLAPREHIPFNTPPAAKSAVGFRTNCSFAAKMGFRPGLD